VRHLSDRVNHAPRAAAQDARVGELLERWRAVYGSSSSSSSSTQCRGPAAARGALGGGPGRGGQSGGAAAAASPQQQRVLLRISGRVEQTAAGTGRLAMDSPNLQTVPKPTRYSMEGGGGGAQQPAVFTLTVRSAFVPAPGCVLLAVDYSQVGRKKRPLSKVVLTAT